MRGSWWRQVLQVIIGPRLAQEHSAALVGDVLEDEAPQTEPLVILREVAMPTRHAAPVACEYVYARPDSSRPEIMS